MYLFVRVWMYLPIECLLQRPDVIRRNTANEQTNISAQSRDRANLDPKELGVMATRHGSISVTEVTICTAWCKVEFDNVSSLQQTPEVRENRTSKSAAKMFQLTDDFTRTAIGKK